MKCEICKNKIQQTFLNKILGTYIKDKEGKKHIICSECQKRFSNDKEKILEQL